MPISIPDMVLILVIAGFAFTGFWFGLIHMIGSLVGIVAAAIVAGRYFDFVSDKLSFLFGGYDNLGRIITFVLIFLIITRLVGFLFMLIDKIFNIISILPFLKTANRLGGVILGLIEGIILVGLALYLAARYPLGETITNALSNSIVVDYLLGVANQVAPLLPDVVQKIQSVIPL